MTKKWGEGTRILKSGLIVVAIIIMASVTWYSSYQKDMRELEERLRTHLIVDQGVDEKRIVSIEARRSKMPMYPVVVQFNDTPQEYIYVFQTDQWIQLTPEL
ncbi:hypothetical protein [Paenibacillus sp. MER 99-2]|uniref:hypothetical protein n=1 Tax=Paenibacillus sp. MER 99-2 TaxID=2939572 RepID=UPI00203A6D56|nr:hypothetical protein [Paenibacillus sp. MER 99-2]MCM3170774.1 hypothetical protein [Paenibacillus sp. MER 99-2]